MKKALVILNVQVWPFFLLLNFKFVEWAPRAKTLDNQCELVGCDTNFTAIINKKTTEPQSYTERFNSMK